MKGLARFLSETWWLFLAAAAATVVMTWATGLYFYLAFLAFLPVIALYMSAVRYDRDGNHRGM